jgi:2-keto-myo-inositol isomerase
MKPCVAQICTLPTPFADDLARAAEAGCAAVEIWLTKLESHLKTATTDETRRLIEDRNVTLAAAASQGGLLLSRGDQRTATWDHFKRRLDLCQRFGIPVLVVAADPCPNLDASALATAVDSLAEAATWAGGFGVRLALEFAAGGVIACLDTAVRAANEINDPYLGVCLDAFHFTKSASKEADVRLLTSQNLAHVQLCDVAGVPRELMADGDRIFPGEGDFDLNGIVARLREIGYDASVSLELMNPELWKAKPTQVYELGLTALNRTLSPGR